MFLEELSSSEINFGAFSTLNVIVVCVKQILHCGIAVGLANVQWKMHTSGGMMVSCNE